MNTNLMTVTNRMGYSVEYKDDYAHHEDHEDLTESVNTNKRNYNRLATVGGLLFAGGLLGLGHSIKKRQAHAEKAEKDQKRHEKKVLQKIKRFKRFIRTNGVEDTLAVQIAMLYYSLKKFKGDIDDIIEVAKLDSHIDYSIVDLIHEDLITSQHDFLSVLDGSFPKKLLNRAKQMSTTGSLETDEEIMGTPSVSKKKPKKVKAKKSKVKKSKAKKSKAKKSKKTKKFKAYKKHFKVKTKLPTGFLIITDDADKLAVLHLEQTSIAKAISGLTVLEYISKGTKSKEAKKLLKATRKKLKACKKYQKYITGLESTINVTTP